MAVLINEMKVQGTADSTSDVFLSLTTKKAGKIKGEVTTSGHTDDILVYGWSFGVTANTAMGAPDSAARRTYKHVVLVKNIDSASTGLMSALKANDQVKEAKLVMRKAGGDALDYFTMTLGYARIAAINIDVGADGRPLEKIEIAFSSIEVEYQRQQAVGISSGSYSFQDEWIV